MCSWTNFGCYEHMCVTTNWSRERTFPDFPDAQDLPLRVTKPYLCPEDSSVLFSRPHPRFACFWSCYEWNHTMCTFSVWFLSLEVIFVDLSLFVVSRALCSFSLPSRIPSAQIYHNPFNISQATSSLWGVFGLFLLCYEFSCTCLSVDISKRVWWVNTQEWDHWFRQLSMFPFSTYFHGVFQCWTYLHSTRIIEGFHCSSSSFSVGIVIIKVCFCLV